MHLIVFKETASQGDVTLTQKAKRKVYKTQDKNYKRTAQATFLFSSLWISLITRAGLQKLDDIVSKDLVITAAATPRYFLMSPQKDNNPTSRQKLSPMVMGFCRIQTWIKFRISGWSGVKTDEIGIALFPIRISKHPAWSKFNEARTKNEPRLAVP